MMQEYHQPAVDDLDFTNVASGGDLSEKLVDNSVDFGNVILKFSKLMVRWWWKGADIGNHQGDEFLAAVVKQDEDESATPPTLDSEEAVWEMKKDRRILRGPWVVCTPHKATAVGHYAPYEFFMKAIVLKNIVLDREDDLVFAFTNISGASSPAATTRASFQQTGYFRRVT